MLIEIDFQEAEDRLIQTKSWLENLRRQFSCTSTDILRGATSRITEHNSAKIFTIRHNYVITILIFISDCLYQVDSFQCIHCSIIFALQWCQIFEYYFHKSSRRIQYIYYRNSPFQSITNPNSKDLEDVLVRSLRRLSPIEIPVALPTSFQSSRSLTTSLPSMSTQTRWKKLTGAPQITPSL